MISDGREPVAAIPGLAVLSVRPDRNCFMCGSRDWCDHNPDPGPPTPVERMNPNAQARLDGIVAYRHGKERKANPYSGSMRSAWAEGWREAQKKKVMY